METRIEYTHRDLIEKSKRGDRNAQYQLYSHYVDAMFNVSMRMVQSREDAEDILQETLLSVILQITTLREIPRFWPWVYRIAWNKSQDSFRRRCVRASGKASVVWNQPHKVQNESLLEIKAHEEMLRQVKLAGYRMRSVIRSIVSSPSFSQP